jgi:hypothetical protein
VIVILNPLIIFATIPADQYYYFIDSLRSSRFDTRNFVTCAEFLIQEISQRLDSSALLDIRMGVVSGISRFNAAGH